MKNYYDVLGVSIWATEEDIKRAYRKLAFKFHPDYNQGDKFFEARFRDIQEAYDILNDRAKKIQYDLKLHSSLNPPHSPHQQSDFKNNYNSRAETKNSSNYYNQSSNRSDKEPIKKQSNVNKTSSVTNTIGNAVTELFGFIVNILVTIFSRLLVVGLFAGILFGISETCDSKKRESTESNIANGNLDNSFGSPPSRTETTPDLTPEQQYQQNKRELLAQGWNEKNVKNGVMSTCYNFKSKYGRLRNHLAINVGSNTDVAIKVMNQGTNKCVRYVYVNSNSYYEISNLPEGTYYLKIAYGTDWVSRVENGKCIGKFLRNSLYKRGDNVLDFHRRDNYDGSYSIPSFSLQLDVIASDFSNQFDSQSITEGDFNN